MKLPVLLYHHVGPQPQGVYPGLSVTPEIFERQIRWLARLGFTSIRSSDWLRHIHEGAALPRKPILITFDDGYADIAKYALPILRRNGFSATVFIVTGLVGKTNSWDQAKGWNPLTLMDEEQIRYWACEGIEFGAHSRTHPDLTKLSDHCLIDEISGSKSDLESLLGAPVLSFAYPYGRYNDDAVSCVKKHFKLAFTTDDGLNRVCSERSRLSRIWVDADRSVASLCLSAYSEMFSKTKEKVRLRARLANPANWLGGVSAQGIFACDGWFESVSHLLVTPSSTTEIWTQLL